MRQRNSKTRKVFRSLGVDISRYPSQSSEMPRILLLEHNGVDLVIDVGAARGDYVKKLREFGYRGKAISFEPLPEPFATLQKRSSSDNGWTSINGALGNREGVVTINVSENSDSSSVLPILPRHRVAAPGSRVVSSITAKQFTVDQIIEHETSKSVFLKLDVQGYEHQALRGAASSMERIVGLEIELSFVPLYENQILFPEMMSYLEERGFELRRIAPGFTDPETGAMLQADGIFFRK